MRPRQIGYPLSFRGQVCETQGSLPCFPSMVHRARRLPSLRRVPVSPVPRPRRYYEAATTSRRTRPSAYVFASGFHMVLAFRARRSAPGRRQAGDRAWSLAEPALPFRRFPRGCRRDLSGSQVTHPVPSPCSKTPVEPDDLTMSAVPVLPPHPTRRWFRRFHDLEAYGRASVPAVYASRAALPPPMQDSLPAGGLRLYREGVEPSGSR